MLRCRVCHAVGHGLAAVCERELELVLDKREQTSDWRQRPLTAEQVAYAALDAEVLVALWGVFGAGDAHRGQGRSHAR